MTEEQKRKIQAKNNAKHVAEYRSKGWSKGWKDANQNFSHPVAHEHLASAEAEIQDPQLLAHLKSSAIMIKSLHSE